MVVFNLIYFGRHNAFHSFSVLVHMCKLFPHDMGKRQILFRAFLLFFPKLCNSCGDSEFESQIHHKCRCMIQQIYNYRSWKMDNLENLPRQRQHKHSHSFLFCYPCIFRHNQFCNYMSGQYLCIHSQNIFRSLVTF